MKTEANVRWANVPGYEGVYRVSNDGRVFSDHKGQEKSPVLHRTGFLGVTLFKWGEPSYFLIHHLVVEAFCGKLARGARVIHVNGDKLDNRLENLSVVVSKKKPKRARHRVHPLTYFWSNVQKGAESDCWLWIGSKNSGGYGSLTVDGKSTMAHRYSYVIHKGEIPRGLVVMHKCDNPACVNPIHLSVGTYSENILDAIKKGRFKAKGKRKAR